jgi:RNA recognition motif-containing protein
MEINFKIKLPEIKISESNNQENIQLPKALKICYEYAFDNSKTSINRQNNQNKQNNVIMIDSSELVLNGENNNLLINKDKENTLSNNENDKENSYENTQALKKEEKGEPLDNNIISKINQCAETTCLDANHADNNIRKNQYKERNNEKTPILVERKKLSNDYKVYNHQNKNEENLEIGEDLFVIGVNDEIHEDDLIKTFSLYGEVVLAKIIKDKFTKKAKGIAFVKYKEKESAICAMNNKDKIHCNGFPLTIKYNIKNKENKYFKEEREIRFNRKSVKEEKLNKLKFFNRERSREKDLESGEILDE